MKKIDILVPCYNESQSVEKIYSIVTSLFSQQLRQYDYCLIFADDYSTDDTRSIIRKLAAEDPEHVKAVFNASNFGLLRNVFSAFQVTTGDAVFLAFGDMQDPFELLPEFVKKWESGIKVILGQKISSKENSIMFFFRKIYYKLIEWISEKKQIQQYTGYGLYDRTFVRIINSIEELQPYLKQVVAEYVSDYEIIPYQQNESARGKSNFNFYRNYDFAMEGITSSTKRLMRFSTLSGVFIGSISGIYALSVIIKKILYWNSYSFGMASLTVGVFFLGAMILFFVGILGEYILSINTKTLRRPRVVVGEYINFEKE